MVHFEWKFTRNDVRASERSDVQHVKEVFAAIEALLESFLFSLSLSFTPFFKLQVHSPQKAHFQRCALFNVDGGDGNLFAFTIRSNSDSSKPASEREGKKLINFQLTAEWSVGM